MQCDSEKRKRINYPFNNSSLTVHRLNMLDSARSRATNLNRIDRLEIETMRLIELDRAVLLSRSRKFTTNEAFSLLISLNARKSLPSVIFLNSVKAVTVNDSGALQ